MKGPELEQRVQVAADQVASVEARGGSVPDAIAAVEAVLGDAEGMLLQSRIPRLGADAIAAYEAFASRTSIEELAALHERSLRSFPELALVCRSLAVLDIEAHATRNATPMSASETFAAAAARARVEARRRFAKRIAAAIVKVADHELAPVARALIQAEDLMARLAAAQALRAAAAERVRDADEQQAAGAAVTAAAAERKRKAEAAAADEAHKVAQLREQHQERLIRGEALAVRLRAIAARSPSAAPSIRIGMRLGWRQLYDLADLIRQAPELAAGRLAELEDVLASGDFEVR